VRRYLLMARQIDVLLIDDDPAQCETLADILTDHDCSVTACPDPHLGETLGRSRRFDLVLLDLKMDSLGGLDILRSIYSYGHSCIIILTGITDTGPKRAALAAGADAVMDKPVDIPRLLEIARDVQLSGDCKATAPLVPAP
jgi:DNA-binding response OmpR family regulator